MAIQTINNGELLNVIRTKINQNFAEMELLGNKTQAITATPSTTKYPSEKAVSDYASKIYLSSSVPVSKSGDLVLHTNAPAQAGGSKGKLKINSGGSLTEFIPDRSLVDYRTSSAFSSSNPVLMIGELAIESDTMKQKVGNGSSPYNSLSYLTTSGESIGLASGGTTENGWIKFPNNMIMQWGLKAYQTDSNSNFDQIVTLPTSFTSGRIYSHGILETGAIWDDDMLMVHSRSSGNSAIRFTVEGGLQAFAYYELHWIAIGF